MIILRRLLITVALVEWKRVELTWKWMDLKQSLKACEVNVFFNGSS